MRSHTISANTLPNRLGDARGRQRATDKTGKLASAPKSSSFFIFFFFNYYYWGHPSPLRFLAAGDVAKPGSRYISRRDQFGQD